MPSFAETFLNIDIIIAGAPILWAGLRMTLLLSLVAIPLGLTGGIALALLSTLPSRWLRLPLMAWVDFFRALPRSSC